MFCRYYFKYSNDNAPAYTNEACTPISSGYQIRKSEMMAVENSFFSLQLLGIQLNHHLENKLGQFFK